MTAVARIQALLRGVRMRLLGIAALEALLLALTLAAVLCATLSLPVLLAVLVLASIVCATLRLRVYPRYDSAWVLRQLDARLPQLEDSSALLLADADTLSSLQRLQLARVQVRFEQASLPELRAPWPWRRLSLCLLAAAVVIGVSQWLQHRPMATTVIANKVEDAAASRSKTAHALATSIRVTPPRYTGLPERTERALDARVPAGSQLRWSLQLDTQVQAASLVFEDSTSLPLQAAGARWQAERVVDGAQLYRLQLDGRLDALHRIEVIADAPPQIELRKPERSLNEVDTLPTQWELEFVARDDYGLGDAELRIQRTEGDGENISIKSQTQAITGSGDARERRYRVQLDVAKLGLQRGQDLIVRLAVADRREPKANLALGPAVLLRWIAAAAKESEGMEGLARQAVPAYFRSERQLIIDTEALIAQRGSLDEARFSQRADELGVDQKMLRLRYGQFLGEEFEGEGEHAPEKSAEHSAEGSKAPRNPNEAHEQQAKPRAFGDGTGISAEYGHVHDVSEAATLLDEGTKKLLRVALDAMWQAELQLRSAQPDAALPHEHAALEAIKQVQQATRIYLARSGLQLPQPDPARRLSGKREGLEDRAMSSTARNDDAAARDAWHALAQAQTPDWAALDAWAAGRSDAAALRTVIDAARRDPACADCVEQLRTRLWPLLPPPAAGIAPRSAGAGWLGGQR